MCLGDAIVASWGDGWPGRSGEGWNMMEYMYTLTPLAPPQLIGIYGSPMEHLGLFGDEDVPKKTSPSAFEPSSLPMFTLQQDRTWPSKRKTPFRKQASMFLGNRIILLPSYFL